ncbi:MAG: 50S ribosomal protein L35ae [Nitrososphaerota archaeon]
MAWLTGFILSERFKQSGRSKNRRDYIIDFPGVSDKETASLLTGKRVEYRDKSVRITGQIIKTHGVNGRLRARFTKPLPGRFWDGRVFLRLDKSILELAKSGEPSSQTV